MKLQLECVLKESRHFKLYGDWQSSRANPKGQFSNPEGSRNIDGIESQLLYVIDIIMEHKNAITDASVQLLSFRVAVRTTDMFK